MADRRSYYFTRHAKERFIQRSDKKFKHLDTCRKNDCDVCRNLVMEINEKASDYITIHKILRERLDKAKVCRACVNDTEFMSHYYKTHGYDEKFEMLVHEDMCFVAIHKPKKKLIVTCIPSKTYSATRQVTRKKYKKKKKEHVAYDPYTYTDFRNV